MARVQVAPVQKNNAEDQQLLGIAGSVLGGMVGGPGGAMAGGKAGSELGGGGQNVDPVPGPATDIGPAPGAGMPQGPESASGSPQAPGGGIQTAARRRQEQIMAQQQMLAGLDRAKQSQDPNERAMVPALEEGLRRSGYRPRGTGIA